MLTDDEEVFREAADALAVALSDTDYKSSVDKYIRATENDNAPLHIGILLRDRHGMAAAERFYELFTDNPRFGNHVLWEMSYGNAIRGNPSRSIYYAERALERNGFDAARTIFVASQLARVRDHERAISLLRSLDQDDAGISREKQITIEFIEFMKYFDEEAANRLFREVVTSYKSSPVAEVEASIIGALNEKRSYMLLRAGDGEGSCVQNGELDEKEYRNYYRANRKEFLNIWFQDESIIDDAGFNSAIEKFNDAIGNADAIGGIAQASIDWEYYLGSRRGIAWVVNTMRKLLALAKVDPERARRTSVHSITIHYELLLSGGLNRLLEGRSFVGLISCHDDLPFLLKRRFGIDQVEFHKVPGEQIHAFELGSAAVEGRHWPDRFNILCQAFDQGDRRGQLFLVAAGFLGKVYADKLKKSGAVVIDIGAVADLWMGKMTRSFPSIPEELSLGHPPSSKLVLVDVGGLGGIQAHWERRIDSITPIVFEPNPPEARALRPTIEAKGGRVIEAALGSATTRQMLNVTKSLGCTSILTPNTDFLERYSIAPAFVVTHTVPVDVIRYDALHRDGQVPAPEVIKIDVQGYESEVLLGFGDLLRNCLGVQVEAHIYEIYKGQKLLSDIVALLQPYGLALRKISPVAHFDGDIVEVDAWFTCDARRASQLNAAQSAKLRMIEEAWEITPHRPVFGSDQFG